MNDLRPYDPSHQDEVIEGMKDAGLVDNRTSEQEVSRYRPLGVALSAALMFMTSAWVLPLALLTNEGGGIALGHDLLLALGTTAGVAASMAFWMLKRWAIVLYIAAMLVVNIMFLLLGQWSLMAALAPAIVAVIALLQLRKM